MSNQNTRAGDPQLNVLETEELIKQDSSQLKAFKEKIEMIKDPTQYLYWGTDKKKNQRKVWLPHTWVPRKLNVASVKYLQLI